jgi:carbon storage regulator
MLVLSRKQGESIVIGHDIVVNVVDIGRGRVQIGVTAPAHMPIHREEIYRRIQQENSARKPAVFSNPAVPSGDHNCVTSA